MQQTSPSEQQQEQPQLKPEVSPEAQAQQEEGGVPPAKPTGTLQVCLSVGAALKCALLIECPCQMHAQLGFVPDLLCVLLADDVQDVDPNELIKKRNQVCRVCACGQREGGEQCAASVCVCEQLISVCVCEQLRVQDTRPLLHACIGLARLPSLLFLLPQ